MNNLLANLDLGDMGNFGGVIVLVYSTAQAPGGVQSRQNDF